MQGRFFSKNSYKTVSKSRRFFTYNIIFKKKLELIGISIQRPRRSVPDYLNFFKDQILKFNLCIRKYLSQAEGQSVEYEAFHRK